MPAIAQTASQQDELRAIDELDDLRAEERELNGLRGVLDPDQDPSSQSDERSRPGADGQPEAGAPEEGENTTASGLDERFAQEVIARRQQPRQQNRVDETDEQDPYAALGVRMGSFLLFPELTSESLYDDNIFLTSTGQESDRALVLTPSLRIQSDWNRHSLAGTLSGVRSFHERFTSENDETFQAGVIGQFDILSTTNLVAAAGYSEEFEDRSSTDFPEDSSDRAKTRRRQFSLEGNRTFNRVTLTLRGNLSEEDFEDGTTETGAIVNNDDRDFTEQRLTGRAAYEFQPGVSAFIETSVNEREFAQTFDDDGTQNGSSGYDVQGGLSFRLTDTLTGEASAGYAIQKADDASLEDVDGLIFNAGLEWRATALTQLRLDASSEVAETTEAGSAGTIVREVEVSVEHRPRRHILLGASLGYEVETFAGSDDEDQDWVIGLTGEYNFTRSVALMIGYEHQESFSNDPGDDYAVDQVRLGLRLRR